MLGVPDGLKEGEADTDEPEREGLEVHVMVTLEVGAWVGVTVTVGDLVETEGVGV